ncbi:MAG: nitrate/nitrite transporter NrtS [Gemmatimonadota bacterium]|nr:nitrate/nitrite transporter NrtS [Gemmatimonadota bacterium]
MRSRVDIAVSRPVVLRALRYAVVVGALLIAINHGDAILRGDISRSRFLQMLLTTLVPYMVSTLSSVEASRDRGQPERRA